VKPQSPALQPGKYSMPSTRLSMPCAIASSASSIVRRTATRYDKLIESFAAFVLLACIRIWIKFVHTT